MTELLPKKCRGRLGIGGILPQIIQEKSILHNSVGTGPRPGWLKKMLSYPRLMDIICFCWNMCLLGVDLFMLASFGGRGVGGDHCLRWEFLVLSPDRRRGREFVIRSIEQSTQDLKHYFVEQSWLILRVRHYIYIYVHSFMVGKKHMRNWNLFVFSGLECLFVGTLIIHLPQTCIYINIYIYISRNTCICHIFVM